MANPKEHLLQTKLDLHSSPQNDIMSLNILKNKFLRFKEFFLKVFEEFESTELL